MNVVVNGRDEELQAPVTVGDLVRRLAPDRGGRGIAVAVNGEVVAKTRWDEHELEPGSRVEVLTAIGGG